MSTELEVACAAATAGSEIVQAYFRSLASAEVRPKGSESETHNLVTNADIEAEEAIAATIHAAYPDHAILGEEQHDGATDAEHLWIIDPLDGTTNFSHGIPHFGVSVAYYREGKAHTGVVVNPVGGGWHVAQRQHGAWRYDSGQWIRCRVMDEQDLRRTLIGVGFYYDRGAMMRATLDAVEALFRKQIHGIRRFGTASLDLCMVADGQFGSFFEFYLSPWDFAAGQLLVTEAGGRVSTCEGSPLGVAPSSVLASNGHLHDEILEVVSKHLEK
ncbi:MAG: inositol monophosphatase [Planctomycetales bacterium]|nr:inositol monophosphatase [Planctomycetales bacterium]